MTPIRIPIPDDCCAVAREMIAHGLDPATVLEFMRDDVVCLRGTARAFASRKLTETSEEGPRHVRYDAVEEERLALLRRRHRPPMR